MYKAFFYFLLIIGILGHPRLAQAGAALDQRLKAVQQQRIQQQQQLQQQAMLKQRQAQQTAVAQQVAKQQVEVMQQQLALQQSAQISQQQLIKQQLQQQAIYQQQVYNQAVQARPQIQQPGLSRSSADMSAFPAYEPYVEEVVDMGTLWVDLEITSEAWPLIIDMKAKEIIVAKFIEDYRIKGIEIKKDPYHYAKLIDAMSFDKPEMLKNPFDRLLQIVAIVEYDFNNGANPDMMAQQVLGDQGYLQNKKRLGK